jgi:aminotransferase in exopolysaccharide biosynthesis
MKKKENPFGIIPLHEPVFLGNEKKYLLECIDSTFVSSVGTFVNKFEESLAQYTGAKHAIACVNGTAAIHTSLLVSGIEAGDEVILPTVTFIAPVNAVQYTGAHPLFMDCDEYYNIDTAKVIEFLRDNTYSENGFTYNKTSRRRIAAIIPVHVFGNAVWMDELMVECERRNIHIIEDATEALGSYYTKGKFRGKKAGSIGKIGCFSFNGNKIITTGGGGMIITDDDEVAAKAKYLTTQAKDDALKYIHNEVGYNYRLTNLQAAVGLAQMEQLPGIIQKKKENLSYYQEKLSSIKGIQLAPTPEYAVSNNWLYAIRLDKNHSGTTRDELMMKMNNLGIHLRPLWYLNHLQKPYLQCETYKITKAPDLLHNTLNIPSSFNLNEEKIDYIIDALIS